jgi:hypothetical protein
MSTDMAFVHSRTWGRMYTRKASDTQRPKIIILAGEWLAKKSDMAAPDRIDLLPMSAGPKPNSSLPPCAAQTERMRRRTKVLVMSRGFDLLYQVHTGVSSLKSGTVQISRWRTAAQRSTGQRSGSPVLRWVLASSFLPFFWSAKTTVMK